MATKKKSSKVSAKKAPAKVRAKKKVTKKESKKKGTGKKEGSATAELVTPTALTSLRGEIDELFGRYFPGFPRISKGLMDWDPFRRLEMPSWPVPKFGATPNVDLSETDEGYEISAELPGLDEKELDVSVTDRMLTISGEKREARDEEKQDYHVRERRYGSFQRSFRLPEDVDGSKISGEFSKGLLKISLPKSKKSKSVKRRLKVESK